MRHNNHASGMQLPQSKLNEKLVKMIRDEHKEKIEKIRIINDIHSIKAIAARYHVSMRTIANVLDYSTWKHVK